ncbi:hypothetical protein JOM56_012282 [Amanita muscaria]
MLSAYKLVLFHLFTFVTSVPLANNATLFANGLEAQRLNAQFKMLRPSDSCPIDGQKACIPSHSTIALCKSGKWHTTSPPCLATLNCFAIPLLTTTGTIITCTSLKSAESILSSVGVTGGIAGSNSTSSPDNNNGGKGANATMTTGSSMTATLTVTAIPTHFEQTKTISPQEATQLLASLTVHTRPTHTMTQHHHRPSCNKTNVVV